MTNPRQALDEAFKAIYPEPSREWETWNGARIAEQREEDKASFMRWNDWRICKEARFRRFLDAEAWTDAALMLVPTDGSMELLDIKCSYEPSEPGVWSACTIRWYPPHKSGNNWHARIESGPILALAIAQAALRAQEAGNV